MNLDAANSDCYKGFSLAGDLRDLLLNWHFSSLPTKLHPCSLQIISIFKIIFQTLNVFLALAFFKVFRSFSIIWKFVFFFNFPSYVVFKSASKFPTNRTLLLKFLAMFVTLPNQSTLYLFLLLVICLLFLLVIKFSSDPPIQYSYSYHILSYVFFQRLPFLVICLRFLLVIKSLSDPLLDLFSKSCLKMYGGFNNVLAVSSIFHQNPCSLVGFCDLISLLPTDTCCCFSNWRCWSRDKFHTFTMWQRSHNGTQPSSPSQSPKLSLGSSSFEEVARSVKYWKYSNMHSFH